MGPGSIPSTERTGVDHALQTTNQEVHRPDAHVRRCEYLSIDAFLSSQTLLIVS